MSGRVVLMMLLSLEIGLNRDYDVVRFRLPLLDGRQRVQHRLHSVQDPRSGDGSRPL